MNNSFFKRNQNVKLHDIFKCLGLKKIKENFKVNDIKDLESAGRNDISFFHKKKYIESVYNTKTRLIITNKKFRDIIPKKIIVIEVSNVLLAVAKINFIN